jgi:hypothetical protein
MHQVCTTHTPVLKDQFGGGDRAVLGLVILVWSLFRDGVKYQQTPPLLELLLSWNYASPGTMLKCTPNTYILPEAGTLLSPLLKLLLLDTYTGHRSRTASHLGWNSSPLNPYRITAS